MIRKDFLPLARPHIGDEEISAVTHVLRSGFLTTGPKVFEFEHKLADYLKKDDPLYTVALNSCTACLFLALEALGIKPGDEIIIPTWTFAATAQVVEWIGAKPVFCDVESDSLNIDVEKAESVITPRTKGIIPVHFAGYPCDMERIQGLADRYDLKIVEDAAHAIGTRYNGIKIGNFSDVTCFSFYATKNLTMGEGGAAVSKNPKLIEKIRKLSYFGINKEAYQRYTKKGSWFYDVEELGYKCNLDSLHAALGVEQLRKLEQMNKRRRDIAAKYRTGLDARIGFTCDTPNHLHIYHLFPILLPIEIARDTFMEHLKVYNIGSSVHFIPLHRHTLYRKCCSSQSFPVADGVFPRIVSIPMYPEMTDPDIGYVIENINAILKEMS
jgi:perosamine synthetase